MKNGYFSYSSFLIQNIHHFYIKQKSIRTVKLSEDICPKLFCSIIINTSPLYHINVTVMNFSFVGNYHYECKHGGLLSAELLGNKYKESAPLCESEIGYPGRSFYSENSSLIMVLYWYKHLSSIETTLFISLTKCKAVEINTYALRSLCLYKKIANPNGTECSSLLSSKNLKYSDEYDQFEYSLPENQCVVFVLVKYGNYSVPDMNLFLGLLGGFRLRPEENHELTHTLKLQIRARLKPSPLTNYQPKCPFASNVCLGWLHSEFRLKKETTSSKTYTDKGLTYQ